MRLGGIGYRLATANARYCETPQMMTGLILHDIGAYPKRYRAAVSADLGMTDGFGIRGIIPGSAASHSDLKPGDEIVAINQWDVRNIGKELLTEVATYERTERFIDLLDAELRNGPVELAINRSGQALSISLTADPGCGGRTVVMPEQSLNAWSDGRYVGLTTRMLEFVQDDEELAFVVAHEMAHNFLGHDETKGVGNPLTQFGIGTKQIKLTELEADAYAVRMMAAAGYQPAAAERMLRRLGKTKWLKLSITHPSTTRRIAAIETEIAKLQQSGS